MQVAPVLFLCGILSFSAAEVKNSEAGKLETRIKKNGLRDVLLKEFNQNEGNKNATDARKRGNPRIVGGIDARRYEFPFVASYQELNGKHICGGMILNSFWILSAAHCMVVSPGKSKVVAGILELGEETVDTQVVGVGKQIIHPRYSGGFKPAANDIAILQLQWALRWTAAVQPIKLPRQDYDYYGYGWTAGWGYRSSAMPMPSKRLQQLPLYLLTIPQCANVLQKIAGGIGPLDNNMLCGRGGYAGNESICKGDSGGPLAVEGVLIGVTSWTLDPCGIQDAPSVFMRVGRYLDFIRYYVPGV